MTYLCYDCIHNSFNGKYCYAMGGCKGDARTKCRGDFWLPDGSDARIVVKLSDRIRGETGCPLSHSIQVAHKVYFSDMK